MEETSRVALIVAVVSIIGSVSTSIVAGQMAASQRAAEVTAERQRFSLEQRQKLLERLSVLVNSKGRAERLKQVLLAEEPMLEASDRCVASSKGDGAKLLSCKKLYDPHEGLSAHKEYVELHASYASTLQLTKVSFGKEVADLVEKLMSSQRATKEGWWDVPPDTFRDLLRAMHKDIQG